MSMDKPVEGRETEAPKSAENGKAEAPPVQHNKQTIRKPLPPRPGQPGRQGFEFLPGNAEESKIRMLSSINQNLAFLARTIHDYLHPDDVGKDISEKFDKK